jgi:homoserine O-acetyltransferase
MLAHITYLSDEGMHAKFGRRLQDKARPEFGSDEGMHAKFGRRLQDKARPEFGFGVEFEVESYLDYQGRAFVQRFDANSYLYITRAMDYYDAADEWGGGDLLEACRRAQSAVMVVSFSSDWLYPPRQCLEFALALSRNGKPVTYVEVPSRYGHDAFLVETRPVGNLVRNFLASPLG